MSLVGHNTSIGSDRVILSFEQEKVIELVALIMGWACFTVLGQVMNVFGIFTNIINIIVFTKQGFKDTVNICLLGLAVSDIGCLLTLLVTNIFCCPAFSSMDLFFDAVDVAYLTSGIPHTVFTRITCWITALITLERCLCIAAPLKVKTILTPKRVTIIIISVFIIFMSTTAPVYVANKLDIKFFPERNKTLLGLVYLKNRDAIESVCFVVNNVILPFTSFVIILVCTVTLVYKLQKVTKWRKQSTSSSGDNVNRQTQRVAKMVVMISTLFIVCFTPLSFMFIGVLLEPKLFIGGRYIKILIVIGSFQIILESINSSMNIFIYYKMSIRYREIFERTFLCTRFWRHDRRSVTSNLV